MTNRKADAAIRTRLEIRLKVVTLTELKRWRVCCKSNQCADDLRNRAAFTASDCSCTSSFRL